MPKLVLVGEMAGPFGVRGWVKVKSYTDPLENILEYEPWVIESAGHSRSLRVAEGKFRGGSIVVRLEGIQNRDQATELGGKHILVPRSSFPKPRQGEYYWADLVGLDVHTVNGLFIGRVNGLLETGANDVLEVQGERQRLIPFVLGQYVKDVDLDLGRVVVDWDPEF